MGLFYTKPMSLFLRFSFIIPKIMSDYHFLETATNFDDMFDRELELHTFDLGMIQAT
jgi:hypothetical protein